MTLDGVNPDQYENMEVDVELEEAEKAVRIAEMLSRVTPPKVKSFNINLQDSDGWFPIIVEVSVLLENS